ncbi:MAG: FHA domain-containing protein [Anaerolineae bacterium]|nr:FHA domain-containing protein [Anaerolineae bacterium]
MRETLFALDCGSTNWRIYRATYEVNRQSIRLTGDPQPSPLTSFVERQLATVMLLNREESGLESFGETAYQFLYDAALRKRIRDFFKPCIGSHLERKPLPHQTRYTHDEALHYTKLLLEAALEQLRVEKWRSRSFDDGIRFSFAYPVHWRDTHEGEVFEDFKQVVLSCFPKHFDDQVSFLSEPEAAILSLRRQELLTDSGGVTLVIDSGGSTTDLTAGHLNPVSGELEGVHRYGEPHGGGLYDDELARYIADELRIPAPELTEDPNALHLLRMFGRQMKEALSYQLLHPTGAINPPQRAITIVLHNGKVYRKTVRLNETTFRDVVRHPVADFEFLIDNGLRSMRLQERDIRQVILVGGGAQLFTTVQYLRKRFGEKNVILSDNPSETVVHGLSLERDQSFGLTKPWLVARSVKVDESVQEPGFDSKQTLAAKTPDELKKLLVMPPSASPVSSEDEIKTVLDSNVAQSITASQWRLVASDGQTHALNSPVMTIGRKRTNAIVVNDDQASRTHAEIRREGKGGFEVVDLGSSNGTFVNEERLKVKQPRSLNAGDKIRIGRITFIYLK